MTERLIQSRKARATGTVVDLVYAPDADPAQPWETICTAHGGVCSHQTLNLARAWAPHPDEWCEDCMHGEGTLSGEYDPWEAKGRLRDLDELIDTLEDA